MYIVKKYILILSRVLCAPEKTKNIIFPSLDKINCISESQLDLMVLK